MPRGGEVSIVRSGSTLHVERDHVRYRIVRLSAEAFYVPGLDWILGFAKGTGAAISKIHLSSNVVEQWGTRAF